MLSWRWGGSDCVVNSGSVSGVNLLGSSPSGTRSSRQGASLEEAAAFRLEIWILEFRRMTCRERSAKRENFY